MVKRFMIGFVAGLGLMYYYLHYYNVVAGDAKQWGTKAASSYRGDKTKSLADELLEKKRQERKR